jgi:hypothetical protein
MTEGWPEHPMRKLGRKVLKRVAALAVAGFGGVGLVAVPDEVVETLLEPSELAAYDDADRWRVVRLAALDPRPSVRESVAAHLAEYDFGLGSETEELLQLLAHDPYPGVQRVLSASLGRLLWHMHPLDRCRIVTSLAADDDPRARFVIASALAWPFEALGARTALAVLSEDPSDDVRAAALRASRARNQAG